MTNHPTPNNLANPNYVPPVKEDPKEPEGQGRDKQEEFTLSWPGCLVQNRPEPAESTVYEASSDPKRRRLLIDDQVFMLPPLSKVDIDVRFNGSGVVTLQFETKKLQVVDADNRIVKKRSRRSKK